MNLTPYRSKHARGYKGLIVFTNYGDPEPEGSRSFGGQATS